jgi:hypothetical protein
VPRIPQPSAVSFIKTLKVEPFLSRSLCKIAEPRVPRAYHWPPLKTYKCCPSAECTVRGALSCTKRIHHIIIKRKRKKGCYFYTLLYGEFVLYTINT